MDIDTRQNSTPNPDSPSAASPVGAALVVGAGISGMQSALDLAEAGFLVHLVEKNPSIAGTMPMLDKTFPTNDCSMCILSPRVVDVGSHMNIKIHTQAEMVNLTGEPGNFTATIKKRPRYVDVDLCVSCGRCENVCPQDVKNPFNQGLDQRKAIYKPYAQAFPNAYVIDKQHCQDCGACAGKCPRQAIKYDMSEELVEVAVGAVILAPGFEIIDPGMRGEYGYGIYSNVVTSLQFERMLSASGPHQGHLVLPSDGTEPKKIAFIQCVGSREPGKDRNYCSGVCCMYASKEAVVAKEHAPGLDAAIFCIDVRAFGKGFEQYYQRAKSEYGIRYIKCMISSVKELQQTKELILHYRTPEGQINEEKFDLVVLSVGLRPPAGIEELARTAGINLDVNGFCLPGPSPGSTTRPGVFAAGAFAGPKDIPETVIEASAAAGYVSMLLGRSRHTLTEQKKPVPEKEVAGELPRTGVFVCHCGINIGSVINVPEVKQYAKTLPGVVHAGEFTFACAQDSLDTIKKRINSQKLNRVVVASCTPRTHAPLFQNALREAGLNPYLYEHVNIREHSSWVHRDKKEEATAKAKDLVRMAAAKAQLLKPVSVTHSDINRTTLVVGGGAAGMATALSLSRQGFGVHLVEKEHRLGGRLAHMYRTITGVDTGKLLIELIAQVEQDQGIHVITGARVKEVAGYPGNYRTVVETREQVYELIHGAAVLSTGAREVTPGEYMYGEHPGVLTQTGLEQRIKEGNLSGLSNIVMIQCAGTRNDKRPWCSRICCSHAIKNSLLLKEKQPGVNIYVFYRDIRVYGKLEQYYTQARRAGVTFIQYEPENPPQVKDPGSGKLNVSAPDPALGFNIGIDADLVVLSAGVEANSGNEELSKLFKVPLSDEGFLLEAHMKLRPVDFAADGMYLCGLAQAPKLLDETLAQASAAAMRAATLLAKDRLENVAITAYVDEEICIGCGLCVKACSYNARYLEQHTGIARVYDTLCQGCGACVAACPSGASQQKGFEKGQMLAMMKAALL